MLIVNDSFKSVVDEITLVQISRSCKKLSSIRRSFIDAISFDEVDSIK